MEHVIYQNWGLISYREAWEQQEIRLKELVDRKLANRKRIETGEVAELQKHYLIFCEHHPVFTLGKSGSDANLLLDEAAITQQGFEFFRINRGGDITYHGPGQIVGYPIFDLDCFFTDVHKYVRYLEEAIIRTLAEYGLEGDREKGYTGVWLAPSANKKRRKICAIGVHLSRWVTMHGFAFNVNTNLNHFNHIIPCGISSEDKSVTSMEAELGHTLDMDEVRQTLKRHFASLFDFQFIPA
jgi:lipoyl(octanoyl) transferase